jgi:hypothetical protein
MPAKKDKYQVVVEEGSFGFGYTCFRVSVVEDRPGKPRVRNFNAEPINVGFGKDPQDAIDDFIRRNNSDVLDMIFDL